ncbi:MAG: ATP-binding protein [Thermodesulfobacteriota bacterium]
MDKLLADIDAYLYYKDAKMKYVTANDAFARWVGVPVEAIAGKSDYDFFSEKDAAWIRRQDREVLSKKETRSGVEGPLTGADGRTLWTISTRTPRRNSRGDVIGLVGLIMDITGRKDGEDRVKQRERLFGIVSRLSRDLIVVNDPKEKLNAAFNMLGEVMDVDRIRLYRSVTDKETCARSFALSFEWKLVQESEDARNLRSVMTEGFGRWQEVMAGGQPILGTVEEFPDSEREILSREGIESLLAVPIQMRDEFWGFLEFDYFFTAKTFNETEISILSLAAMSIGGSYMRDQLMRQLKKAYAETRRVNQDLEKAIETSNRFAAEAEVANEAKTSFLAGMSHEIRIPLTTIVGFSELLGEPVSEEERREYIDRIRKGAEYLLSLVSDILDLSKIEAGKMDLEVMEVNPVQVVDGVVSMMEATAEKKGLTFYSSYVGMIPKAVKTDPTRLRQILINLLGNAIKFTQEGTVFLTISLNMLEEKGRGELSFAVADTGIGMSKKECDRIFEKFQQANSSTVRTFGGSGLGLAISRKLANMLGGDIKVESRKGKGSVFTLTVDAGPADELALVKVEEERPAEVKGLAVEEPRPVQLNGSILLAEDGPDNRRLLSLLLRREGLSVEFAENGREAMEKALEGEQVGKPFDVILMDMLMPELDGYEATRLLRERGYRRPIVALTAHATVLDKNRCIQAGCDDYIAKPVNRQKLISVVASYLARKEEGPQAVPVSESLPESVAIQSALFMDDLEMNTIIDEFAAGLAEFIVQLEAAFAEAKYKDLAGFAHQMKGAGGAYGYPRLTEESAELEKAAKAEDREAARSMIDALAATCRAVRRGRSME